VGEDRFAKVHGPGHDPQSLYARENAQLRQQEQALANELVQRSLPTVSGLSDALGALAQAAKAGDPQAQHILKTFITALDAAKDAGSKITIVRTNGN
jgi:hypothetical protein